MRYPRLIPLLTTAILCIIGIMLGNWQTRRAMEKEHLAYLQAQETAKPVLNLNNAAEFAGASPFRRVQLFGRFVREWPVYLDNRPLYGAAGFYVLMPFKLKDSEKTILVERGWAHRNPAERSRVTILLTPEGSVQIEGIVRERISRSMELGKPEALKPRAIVQNLEIAEMQKATGLRYADFVLEQSSEVQDGLVRDWPKASAGADRHRAYAFQWYALAGMAALFFIFSGLRSKKTPSEKQAEINLETLLSLPNDESKPELNSAPAKPQH